MVCKRFRSLCRSFACIIGAICLYGCSTNDVVAPSNGSIRGVVRDVRTYSPLKNAQIALLQGAAPVVSDDSGRYSMTDVPSGEYAMRATYSEHNYACFAAAKVYVRSNEITTADMVLKPGSSPERGVVIGRVIDESGKPLQGAVVTTEPVTSKETTAADGTFMILEAPSASITINVVGASRYARTQLVVKPSDTTTTTITAYSQDPSKGWITGKVTSRREPVSEAIIELVGKNFIDTTDDQGVYHIENIPEGDYQMHVTRVGLPQRDFIVSVHAETGVEKDVTLGFQAAVPNDNLELYLPFDGCTEDQSPKHHPMKNIGSDNRFGSDRYGRPGDALVFDGRTSLVVDDASNMNFMPFTIGAWFLVRSYPDTTRILLSKTSNVTGDGYYITFWWEAATFVCVSDSGRCVSSRTINGWRFKNDVWTWLVFAVNEDGTGYVKVRSYETFSIPFVKGTPPFNKEPIRIGATPTIANIQGFVGMVDQLVVYSKFIKVEDMEKIMEAKE